MEYFAAIVNDFQPLNIDVKLFISDVCESPGCVPASDTDLIYVEVRTQKFPSSFDTYPIQLTFARLYLCHVLTNVISS